MRAVQIERFGGPEELRVVDLPEPEPRDGQVRLRIDACGVNFSDIWHTEDTYGLGTPLPYVPGLEVAGRLDDGRRVVALCPAGGGYAEAVAVDRADTFPIADGLDDVAALAALVQGNTAWHLLRTQCRLREGESVLVHAAAGGVGSLAVQLARVLGAGTIVATASTEEKRALATSLGADVVLDPAGGDLADAVRKVTGGRGVDIALDGVGGETFDASFEALAIGGRLGHYGMAGRQLPRSVNPREMTQRNLTVSAFFLGTWPHLKESTADLMRLFAAGDLRAIAGGTYALENAGEALRALGERRTAGKLVLAP